IMISAGFDSRVGDPLGNFTLTDQDFVDLTRVMLHLANEYADGRVVSVLEGGYNLRGLMKATTSHVKALLGEA
ncbi:MAG: histone deacetylase, partial [Verrucomicrobiota bacterium]